MEIGSHNKTVWAELGFKLFQFSILFIVAQLRFYFKKENGKSMSKNSKLKELHDREPGQVRAGMKDSAEWAYERQPEL